MIVRDQYTYPVIYGGDTVVVTMINAGNPISSLSVVDNLNGKKINIFFKKRPA